MPSLVEKATIARARRLRHAMTGGEQKLWSHLKEFRKLYGLHVRKQVPIGPYVVDFAIHAERLVIEVDGHFHEEPDRAAKDAARDSWLRRAGYRVLCFRTGDLDDSFDGCIEEILGQLGLMK